MKYQTTIYVSLLFASIWGHQEKYRLVVENFTIVYMDERYIQATTGISKLNDENAIMSSFKMKFDVPENFKCEVKALLWHNDGFKLQLVQFEKSLKDIVEMEMFDMQSVFLHHSRPPMVWPLKKNVNYRIDKWVPDAMLFPANLPQGKWKVEITHKFINKTKIIVYNMFCLTAYR